MNRAKGWSLVTRSDLLDEASGSVDSDSGDRERMAIPVRVFAVRLQPVRFSLRKTVTIFDLLGVDRSHGAVWDWTHRLAADQDDTAAATTSTVVPDT